jgi:hypothetical protein
VVEVEAKPSEPAPPLAEPAPAAPAPTAAASVESDTLRSSLPSIHEIRASAPDLEQPAVGEADAFQGMTPEEVFWLAKECLTERDLDGCVEACEAALKTAPDHPDLIALAVWARSQLGGADLKALAVQLDEVLIAHEGHVEARYYRGALRKRLGDEAGSLRDFLQVVQLSPGHEGASVALALAEQRKKKESERPSLFGRLFKR